MHFPRACIELSRLARSRLVTPFPGRIPLLGIAAAVFAACSSVSDSGGPAQTIRILATRANFHTIGDSVQLAVQDGSGHSLDARTVAWSSSDSRVVSVAPSGLVRVTGEGSAQVIAQRGAAADTVAISVDQVAKSISVQPSDFGIIPGTTVLMTAVAYDSGGTAVPDVSFTWRSSDASVVAVTPDGKASGVRRGTATIEAAGGGTVGSTTATVVDVP